MIVAIFRNRREAVSIPVRRVIAEDVFVGNNYITYDTSYNIKRGTRMLAFDKFRFDRKTAAKICLRGCINSQDRDAETELEGDSLRRGSYRQRDRIRIPELMPRQAVGAKTFQ